MKFNWGTGITIAIILFMSFILYMVFKMTSTDNDLYAKDYYNQEIGYQKKINAASNTKHLHDVFTVIQKPEAIIIEFPKDFLDKKMTGTVSLYRPNSAKLDKTFPIHLTDHKHVILTDELTTGRYALKIDFTVDGTAYYYEKILIL